MNGRINYIFPKVRDISEWQRLCSSYKFHDQEEYKLDWWLGVIERICYKSNSVSFNISTVKILAQQEFKQWPIEVLCLHDIFQGLISKQKIATIKSINNYITKVWENEIEVEKARSQRNNSTIGFSWIRSIFKKFNSKKIVYNFSEEKNNSFTDNDLFICSIVIEKIIKKIVEDLSQGILGNIAKTSTGDEILLLKNNFDDYLVKNFCHIKDISISDVSNVFLWYFMTFFPSDWIIKPFVIMNTGSNSRINAIKFSRTYDCVNRTKEIEITESDIADIILQTTEEDLQRSISNLEEKYLFHDSKCREYILNDQKQLAINHLKRRKQIEKALNEVNEQLLILNQSRVTLDTSSTKVSLINALESSSIVTKNILNETEISKKLENITQVREEVELAQESINSLIKSCVDDDLREKEKLSSELEKELDELLRKIKITNISSESVIDSQVQDSEQRERGGNESLIAPIEI